MTKAFIFKPAEESERELIHSWLLSSHAAEWFYGEGLQNTINHLEQFFQEQSSSSYWLGYDQEHPFAFFITSLVEKPEDSLTSWCSPEGKTITLDVLIGDVNYLGKGLAPRLIQEFLADQFPEVGEVLIDPEATNARAIHVYKKAGFQILGEFIPAYSPHPHLMMRWNRG
ncbi:MAG: GNAT family N-acetyltransferase [Chlamydiia bacterium]